MSARARRRTPAPMRNGRSRRSLCGRCSFLPTPLFLKRIDHLARHIALIVLGENRLGSHLTRRRKDAFGDNALTLSKQVRQQTLIRHFEIMRAVGKDERDVLVRGLDDRAGLHEAADAQPRARSDRFLSDFGRAVEEHDAVAQRIKRKASRRADDGEGCADESKAAAATGQLASPRPRLRASASRLATALASDASALCASTSAALALSASCSTV